MTDDLAKWLREFADNAASIVEGDRVIARMAADALEAKETEAYRKAAEVVRERAKAHKRGLGLLLTETERYALLATAIEALAKE